MPIFSYQKSGRYFAQVAEGMESLGQKELQELGARDITPVYRGLYFSAGKATLYRINYCSRLLSRILAPLIRFDCHSDKYLYKTASKIEMSGHKHHVFSCIRTILCGIRNGNKGKNGI